MSPDYFLHPIFIFPALIALLALIAYFLHLFYAKVLAETQRREKLFHALVDKNLQPIILNDKNRQVLFASKSIDNLLGFDRDFLLGKNMDDYIHEDDKKNFKTFLRELTKNPLQKNTIEIRIKRKDGSYLWVQNDTINLLSEKNVGAYFVSLRDITKRKELDKQRIASLKKEKEARSVAEAAVKARDEFLSIASHELKTPLTTVLLQLQNTLRRILTQSLASFSGEDLVKSLKIAEHQSQRLSTLIKDLLNVSVVSTGKLQLEKEKVNFSRLANSQITRFEPQIKLAGCQSKLKIENSLICNLDAVRIEQAISNLLTNALKYGPGKPIIVTVKRNGEWATFSIKDHGPGVHKKYQDLIFEPFKRVSNNVRGLGVGLFIAQQIAIAHGGKIKVSSTPPLGAEFIMQLPLEKIETKPKENSFINLSNL